MSKKLREFLSSNKFSIERERLLHLTACRDLKLFAAAHGQRLMITEPELDLDGFDFVISSDFETLHVQSKSTLKKGGRKNWSIRSALIKPSFYNRDLIPDVDGMKVGGYSIGATGGVLIHVVDAAAAEAGALEVQYYYLDIFWLIGVASGMAERPMVERQRSLFLLRQIQMSDHADKIDLRLSDFAKLKSLNSMANFRFHTEMSTNWTSNCHWKEDLSTLPALSATQLLGWGSVRAHLC